jgi:hypothetical protein
LLKPAAEGFTKLYWNIALKIVAESLSSIKMCTAMIPGGHTLGIIAKGEKNVGCFEKQKTHAAVGILFFEMPCK